jgi:hypothetical protein
MHTHILAHLSFSSIECQQVHHPRVVEDADRVQAHLNPEPNADRCDDTSDSLSMSVLPSYHRWSMMAPSMLRLPLPDALSSMLCTSCMMLARFRWGGRGESCRRARAWLSTRPASKLPTREHGTQATTSVRAGVAHSRTWNTSGNFGASRGRRCMISCAQSCRR